MRTTASTSGLPLVVDLDGTLTPTDTLVESVVLLIRQRPLYLFLLPLWLLLGRSGFKSSVASVCRLPVAHLPWRSEFIEWLKTQRAEGQIGRAHV